MNLSENGISNAMRALKEAVDRMTSRNKLIQLRLHKTLPSTRLTEGTGRGSENERIRHGDLLATTSADGAKTDLCYNKIGDAGARALNEVMEEKRKMGCELKTGFLEQYIKLAFVKKVPGIRQIIYQ